METRGRRSRQRELESIATVSAGRKVGRRTRQTAGQDISNIGVDSVGTTLSRPKFGTLVQDPIPRRGAPVGKAFSLADIASAAGSHESRDDGEEEVVRSELQDSQEPISTPNDDDKVHRRQIALLPDLSRAADELMAHLQTGDYEDEAFQWVLDARRRAFEVFREAYHERDNTPFFDLEGPIPQPGGNMSAVGILAKANLVTALEWVQHMLSASDGDNLHFLEALDASFPTLFVPPGRNRPSSLMALEIRTCYLIELLAKQARNADPRKVIASVFCEATSHRDYARLFARGPYRSLGGQQEDEDNELCAERIMEVFSYTRKNKKAFALARLKEKYPLNQVLDGVKQWILEEYPKLQEPGETPRPEPEHFSHLEDDYREITFDSSQETQEIVRVEQSQTAQSLFVNRLSVKQLEVIPQSISRSAAPQRDPPRDYPSHSSVELLMQPTLSATPRKKRAHVDLQDDEEGDTSSEDSGIFETDTRPANHSPNTTVRPSDPAHKRNRSLNNLRRPSSSATASRSSHRARPAPIPTAPAGPASSQIDFEAVRDRKTNVSHRARALNPEPIKHRTPWSDQDTATLIDLVRKCKASWAVIYSKHNDKFQHPRDQQAYRDKARNLKVDLLMVDAPLPPGFDGVFLGDKEIRKLKESRKNPYRREADIDEDGVPTGTEWLG